VRGRSNMGGDCAAPISLAVAMRTGLSWVPAIPARWLSLVTRPWRPFNSVCAVAALVMALIAVSAWSRPPAHVEVVSDPGAVSLLRDQLIRWQAEDQARAAMPIATALLFHHARLSQLVLLSAWLTYCPRADRGSGTPAAQP